MSGYLRDVDSVSALIATGRPLLLAGDAAALQRLPRGNWIGGSIPYFMSPAGTGSDRSAIYVNELPASVLEVSTSLVAPDDLHTFPSRGVDHGFTVIVLPYASEAQLRYAREAQGYPGLFDRPVVGWVAGRHLDDPASTLAVVVDGASGVASSSHAAVMHARLADGVTAAVDIINLFEQCDGDVLTFPETGFEASTVLVNGVEQPMATYLAAVGADPRVPLVADYLGAMINVAVRGADERGTVSFFAPVFAGVEYRIAAPIPEYIPAVRAEIERRGVHPAFACNCVLNYTYMHLDGEYVAGVGGPFTFGEIAYVQVTQTLVYLTIG